jgi:hypothetical protein
VKTSLILLVGLIFILFVLALGCESINRVDNAEFYLKRALDEVGELRQALWNEEYIEDLDFQLEHIANDVESALQELYYMQPNY